MLSPTGRRGAFDRPAPTSKFDCWVRAVVVRFVLCCLCWTCAGLPPVASAAEWVESRRVGQFVVSSEVRLDRFKGLLQTIEDQRADVLATLELEPTQSLIEIWIFASRRSYSDAVSRRAPEGVNRRACFAKGEDGVGHVFVSLNDAFEIDLRHEVTHAVLHSVLPFIPLWLDEGLAEYFEVPAADRASRNPHQARLKWSMRLLWKPNLEALERKSAVSEMAVNDYRESWSWVHFLLHGPADFERVLPSYLQEIESGAPPGPLSGHLRRVDANSARRLVSHHKNWK